MRVKTTLGISPLLLLFSYSQPLSQMYPDTLWLPVTFYDFHSDQSNPEFETPHQIGIKTGMVDSTLDTDRKPVPGESPYLNHYIKYWFRGWERGDSTVPLYNILSGGEYSAEIEYGGAVVTDHDTAFKNIVILDSLPFLYLGRTNSAQIGVYQYINDSFFPLDGRGFGNEGLAHNYSFTMEMHCDLTMARGLSFIFMGDDDVWTFVNGKLRMDLGGIHSASAGSFNLDNIPGLVIGQKYMLDFFYAERHTTESHIRITTNLLQVNSDCIASLILLPPVPKDTICAGDSLTISSLVYDFCNDQINSELQDNTNWRLISGDNSSSCLSSLSGDTVIFSPTKAYTTSAIEASTTIQEIFIRDTFIIYVKPGPANHLIIEQSPTLYGDSSFQNDFPFDSLLIQSDETSGSAYARLRDKFGNFVESFENTIWSIVSSPDIISIQPENNYNCKVVVTRLSLTGEAIITAQSSTSPEMIDSLRVVLQDMASPIAELKKSSGFIISKQEKYPVYNISGRILGRNSYVNKTTGSGIYIKRSNSGSDYKLKIIVP